MSINFKDKKVLVMGLGLLGGGVAAVKWLARHGAKVTVTDLKTRRELASSIKDLGIVARKVRFVLGKHRAEDFRNNEIVVVNPGVPRTSKFLRIAKHAGARLENEASIFFKLCKNPIIAVTGTRGKTTTAVWLHHILKKSASRRTSGAVLTGNSSENPMLGVLDKLDARSPVVVELSSWHLEILPKSKKSPHIAVITNIYPDHLNRYSNIRSYALAKANIFLNQSEEDFLLLNKNNSWTKFFVARKPKSRIVYFPADIGVNLESFKKTRGLHNFYNLNAAILVARHLGIPLQKIKVALKTLPQPKFRQEMIIDRKNMKVINDSTATTPEAATAAMGRFKNEGELLLIAGGTDKKLDYREWAKVVKKSVKPENLYLLNGSATKKMIRELKKIGYFKKAKLQLFEKLGILIGAAGKKLKANKLTKLEAIVLFSPAATSFEKFKNEFERGEKFNQFSLSAF